MRGCPVIIAVFEITPHAFPLQSPVGLAGRGGERGEESAIVYFTACKCRVITS